MEKVKLVAQTSSSRVSILGELQKTYRTAGFRGLFAGNLANVVRVFPMATIVTVCYQQGLKLTPADSEFDAMEPIYRGGVAAIAGCVGQLATYPIGACGASERASD
jgi:hypothetical protein